MPNWAYNSVELIGDSVILHKLQENVSSIANDDLVAFDFNKIKPMPKELNISSSSNNDIDMQYYCMKNNKAFPEEYNALFSGFIDNDFKGTVEEFVKKHKLNDRDLLHGENLYNNFVKYGYATWYEWCLANWGVKWSASDSNCIDKDIEAGTLSYFFDTPWSSPVPVIAILSYQYPDLKVRLETSYEGGEPPDIFEFVAGKMTKHIEKCGLRYKTEDGTLYEDYENIPEGKREFEALYTEEQNGEIYDMTPFLTKE